jgi:hypothetical protein
MTVRRLYLNHTAIDHFTTTSPLRLKSPKGGSPLGPCVEAENMRNISVYANSALLATPQVAHGFGIEDVMA